MIIFGETLQNWIPQIVIVTTAIIIVIVGRKWILEEEKEV